MEVLGYANNSLVWQTHGLYKPTWNDGQHAATSGEPSGVQA